MHVVLYSPQRLPVGGYGGTERVVVHLARGLAELGHRVTLIAGEGSRVPEARVLPIDLRRGRGDFVRLMPEDADILHSHVPFRTPPPVPHVWTMHGNPRPGEQMPANTIFLSADHARRLGGTAYVHNGLDPAEYQFRGVKSDYDLFLGRLHSVKGYHWAIEGAKRSGRRLVLAGGWRPSLHRLVRYVGSVQGAEKVEWLAGARCLWMPALWEEPFGLTLIEALLSGTPVLGTHRGALPEIITPDVGLLGDSVDELVELAARIERVDPAACRARALAHFTHLRMAESYVRVFRHYLQTGVLPPGRLAGTDPGV